MADGSTLEEAKLDHDWQPKNSKEDIPEVSYEHLLKESNLI